MSAAFTQAEFRARLAELGLPLYATAFAEVWKGAQRLRGEMARVDQYLSQSID